MNTILFIHIVREDDEDAICLVRELICILKQ